MDFDVYFKVLFHGPRIYPGGFAKELVGLLPKILRNPPKFKMDVPWWLQMFFRLYLRGIQQTTLVSTSFLLVKQISLGVPNNIAMSFEYYLVYSGNGERN